MAANPDGFSPHATQCVSQMYQSTSDSQSTVAACNLSSPHTPRLVTGYGGATQVLSRGNCTDTSVEGFSPYATQCVSALAQTYQSMSDLQSTVAACNLSSPHTPQLATGYGGEAAPIHVLGPAPPPASLFSSPLAESPRTNGPKQWHAIVQHPEGSVRPAVCAPCLPCCRSAYTHPPLSSRPSAA